MHKPDPELIETLKNLLGTAGFLNQHQAAERQTSFWNSEPLEALPLVQPSVPSAPGASSIMELLSHD